MQTPKAKAAYDGGATTGFASPAADSVEGPVDLSAALDLAAPSKYPVRVRGEGLLSRGIMPGDVLVADTAAALRHGAVAIAAIDGEMRLCILERSGRQWTLSPGNGEESRPVGEADVWALVTAVVRENP